MPTEDEARLLLAKAAATIELDESAPMTLTGLPEPRARRWPVLAAAAAVVVAIGGGFLVAQQAGDDPQPAPPVESPPPSGEDHLLPDDRRSDADGVLAVQRDAADAFVAWARGEGEVPEFADRVRLLDDGGGPFGAPTWIADPTDRRLYSMCSGLPPGDCGIDPTFVIDHHEGEVVPARGRALCQTATDELPQYLGQAVADDLIRLTVPGTTCREDVPVELWINADGEIYAVNLTFVESGNPLDRGSPRDVSARAFVAWARGPEGDPAPPFAPRVRNFTSGFSSSWNTEPELRSNWSGCSGLGFPSCPVDPVGTVHSSRGDVQVRQGLSSCARGAARSFAESEDDPVLLELPSGRHCSLVQLWIDEDGVIYGVAQTGYSS